MWRDVRTIFGDVLNELTRTISKSTMRDCGDGKLSEKTTTTNTGLFKTNLDVGVHPHARPR